MDIVTHALTGAATGAAFGRPVLGAVVAIVPDSALWLRPRLAAPPPLYRAAHGALAPVLISAFSLLLFNIEVALVIFWAWVSHIVLDIPTHGKLWSPRLFWPRDTIVFKQFQEWEWFNRSWFTGLGVALIWSSVWILICLVLPES